MKRISGVDRVGARFGLLTVVEYLSVANEKKKFVVVCACGTRKSVSLSNLLRASSCGCARGRHGHARRKQQTSEYLTWRMMRKRCEDPKNRYWPRYGGRGITVCERWRESFDAFLLDMGLKPSRRHSIDRIDNDRGYEPGNCRWATSAEQNRNHSRNRVVEFGGRKMCIADWAKATGLKFCCIAHRLNAGWTPEDALTRPSQRGQGRAI